jgi:hypothetical protein
VVVFGACGSPGGSNSKRISGSGAIPSKPSGGGDGSFCDSASSAAQAVRSGAAVDPLKDTDALQQQLQRVKRAAAKAPPTIRGDVQALLAYYSKLVEAAQNAHGNQQVFASALQGFQTNQSSTIAAAQRVTTYVIEHCGVTVTTN